MDIPYYSKSMKEQRGSHSHFALFVQKPPERVFVQN